MKNKDIHEWLLDEGIDPLTTVTTEKGEYYLSDILEKHLTEQLRLFSVVGRSELLLAFWDWYCKEDNVDNKYTANEMINAFLAMNANYLLPDTSPNYI